MPKLNRRCALFLCALLLVLALPFPAAAAEETSSALTISWQDGGVPMVGARFDLYLAGSLSPAGDYVLGPAFSALPVSLADLSAQGRQTLAATLEAYAALSAISPAASALTDAQGSLTFSGLAPGLYLVSSCVHIQGSCTYTTRAFLVELPDRSAGAPSHTVTASPKYSVTPTPGGDSQTVRRKVLKIWDDPGHESDRPASVTVYLLRNGVLADTVVLSAANNWRYTWDNLDGNCTWSVAEDVPEGYTVSILPEGVTFVITNTRMDDTPDAPEVPTSPGTPDTPAPDAPEELPYTGQHWWPVSILAASGLLLFLLGCIRSREGRDV